MLVEILTGSKIQVLSSRKQVTAYETIPYNLQNPHTGFTESSTLLFSSLYGANSTYFKSNETQDKTYSIL